MCTSELIIEIVLVNELRCKLFEILVEPNGLIIIFPNACVCLIYCVCDSYYKWILPIGHFQTVGLSSMDSRLSRIMVKSMHGIGYCG